MWLINTTSWKLYQHQFYWPIFASNLLFFSCFAYFSSPSYTSLISAPQLPYSFPPLSYLLFRQKKNPCYFFLRSTYWYGTRNSEEFRAADGLSPPPNVPFVCANIGRPPPPLFLRKKVSLKQQGKSPIVETAYTLFFIRMLFFRPRLPILGWK